MLFSNTVNGANAVAVFMSLIATAKEANTDIYYYLKYLLEHSIEVSEGKTNLDKMLPWSEVYQEYEKRQKSEILKPTGNNDPPITPKIQRKQAVSA